MKKIPKTWAAREIIGKHREFVVFDLETTGLSAKNGDKIIEIGAVRIHDDKIIETYNRLVNPKRRLSRDIINITNITDAMLSDQPEYQEILPEFKDFIGDNPLVAHNASFDMRFLTHYYLLLDSPLANKHLDTIPLLKELYPNLENYRLETVHRLFELDNFAHHRALEDAKMTAQIFVKIQEGYGLLGIGESTLNRTSILTESQLKTLRNKYLKDF